MVRNLAQLNNSVGIKSINFELIEDPQAREIVMRMLDFNPKTRATLKDILKSEWITEKGQTSINVEFIRKKRSLGNINR